MLNNLRQGRQLAKCFSNTFRYIGDLLTLNNPTFEEAIRDIYPPTLELKRTTETDSRLSYLDTELTIVDRKFTTVVFDKRDGANSSHLDSNIPSKPAYGVYMSELVRIGRICDTSIFYNTLRHLISN